MRRIVRDRHLTPEEADHYNKIREEVEKDLPELIEKFQTIIEKKEADEQK